MKTKFISVALVGLLLATSPSSAFAKADVSTLSSENDRPENTNIFTEDKAQKLSPLLEKFKEDLWFITVDAFVRCYGIFALMNEENLKKHNPELHTVMKKIKNK